MTLVDTGEKTMTGGRLKRVLRFIDDEDFFSPTAMACPMWTSMRVVAHHREAGAPSTLTAVRPSGRFGELAMDGGLVEQLSRETKERSTLSSTAVSS